MIVQVKCLQRCWDSTHAQLYTPDGGPFLGGMYELDLVNPAHRKLVDLKTQMGAFIFQFDRAAASNPSSGLYFCPDCGERKESLSQMGIHSKQVHKNTGWNPPSSVEESEVVEEEASPPKPRKGPTCKGCGELFANPYLLVKHKKTCPGKAAEPVVAEVTQEATV